MQTAWPSATADKPVPDTDQTALSSAPMDTPNSPSSLSLLGLLIALLSAFIGGLILNLMPCVLPVLAIKALSFLPKAQEAHPRQRFLAEFYALGIWVTLLTLGGLILLLRAGGAQLGWGFQLQSPFFLVFLCVLFTLIALNLWGIFEIRQAIPSFLSSLGSKHQLFESFLSGALSVLIATPCTAPFMGASVGLAFSIPTWQGMLLFSMLGLGLAFPILLIGWFPKTVNLVPQPGAWMVTFRACLGFPMALTVLWLSWVLAQQAGITAMVLELMLLIHLSACAWAFSLKNKAVGTRTWSSKIAWALLILFIGFQGLWVMWVKSSFDIVSSAPDGERLSTQTDLKTGPTGGSMPLRWHIWSKEAVNTELAQGHPVFVDYTAAWCLSCQFNKLTFQKDSVQAAFKSHNVTLFQADWTRQDPAITRSLNELGRNGVPVYILLKNGEAPHFLSEFVTEQEILLALDAL
jgi:thiol:disulfide interchange protein DsbD